MQIANAYPGHSERSVPVIAPTSAGTGRWSGTSKGTRVSGEEARCRDAHTVILHLCRAIAQAPVSEDLPYALMNITFTALTSYRMAVRDLIYHQRSSARRRGPSVGQEEAGGGWGGGRKGRQQHGRKKPVDGGCFSELPMSMQPTDPLKILFNYSNIHVNFNPHILLRQETIIINAIATYTFHISLIALHLSFVIRQLVNVQQKVI